MMKSSDNKKTAAKKSLKKTAAKKTAIKKQTTVQKPSSLNRTSIGSKKTPAAYLDNDMADAFIQEVTDDVKNDNLKLFWNKYGLFIVLFVVIAVSAAVSFETIKSWRDNQYQNQTESYLKAFETGSNYETSLQALEKIAAGNNGIYSSLARIQIANILFEQNKIGEASDMLQAIVDNEELNPRVRHLAALKLATYKLDTASRAEIQELLQPIADAENSWSPLAKDMLAMAAVRSGEIEEAKEIYNSLLENGNISDTFKNRIQDMLAALNDM